MTNYNQQSDVYKRIKKWFLIGVFVGPIFLIFYFTLTDSSLSTSNSFNKTSLNQNVTTISYNWRALLLAIAGIAFLPLCYLVATKKLNKIYNELTNKYISFESQIQFPEKEKGLAINLVVVVALILFFVGISFNCCGWWHILSTQLSTRLSHSDEPLNMRYILIGITGTITFILTGSYVYITDQNRILDKGRRFDERFDNAVAALSKELNESSLPSHLGAISSLSALASTGSENTQRCLDIICSCNQWMEGYIDEFIDKKNNGPYSFWLLKEDNRIANKNNEGTVTLLQEKRSQQALVAISHILTKISDSNPQQLKELKFYNKMLCGINLSNLKLDGINFNNTYLVAATLDKTSLNKAKLNEVNLQEASLKDTNLQGAHLRYANLQGTSLFDVKLQRTFLRCTDLRGANLNGANLQGASLLDVKLQRASLNYANLQGASLDSTKMQRVSLYSAKLQGIVLMDSDLQEGLLINTELQGAIIDNIVLSNAILLDCNLYGATLSNIRSENIIFNDIMDIGNIKDKKRRKKYINNMNYDMEGDKVKSFTQRMESAWQAMENNQEPDGLEAIRVNSIITKDSRGMYDISGKHLTNLKERWQKLVDDKDVNLLRNMSTSLLLLVNELSRYTDITPEYAHEDPSIYKNDNLVNKLRSLIERLIKNNRLQKDK